MSRETPVAESANHFHRAVSILRVRDLRLSLDHYIRVLGFRVDWQDGVVASVSRGEANVMLCEGDQGQPGTWVYVGVGDAGALYEEYREAGATIRLPPTNYPWAYEMHVEDPDGHVFRLGSEPRQDMPPAAWVNWYTETPPSGSGS